MKKLNFLFALILSFNLSAQNTIVVKKSKKETLYFGYQNIIEICKEDRTNKNITLFCDDCIFVKKKDDCTYFVNPNFKGKNIKIYLKNKSGKIIIEKECEVKPLPIGFNGSKPLKL